MLLNKIMNFLKLFLLASVGCLWAGDEFPDSSPYEPPKKLQKTKNTTEEHQNKVMDDDCWSKHQEYSYNEYINPNQFITNNFNNAPLSDDKLKYLVNINLRVSRVSDLIQLVDQFNKKEGKNKTLNNKEVHKKVSLQTGICRWKIKITLEKPWVTNIQTREFNIQLLPLRIGSENTLEYQSLEALLQSDKAIEIFIKNFHVAFETTTINFGEEVSGCIDLSCSRSYNTGGKGKQSHLLSLPIYIAVMLILDKRIYACRLIPVEPMLKKVLEVINGKEIIYKHIDDLSLTFEDPSYPFVDNTAPICVPSPFHFIPTVGFAENEFSLICSNKEQLDWLVENGYFIYFGEVLVEFYNPTHGTALIGIIPAQPDPNINQVPINLVVGQEVYHIDDFQYLLAH